MIVNCKSLVLGLMAGAISTKYNGVSAFGVVSPIDTVSSSSAIRYDYVFMERVNTIFTPLDKSVLNYSFIVTFFLFFL